MDRLSTIGEGTAPGDRLWSGERPQPAGVPSTSWPLVLGIAAVTIVTFLFIDGHTMERLWPPVLADQGDKLVSLEEGSVGRRLGYLAVAIMGAVLAATRRGTAKRGVLTTLIVALLAMCAVSVVWSDAPALSLRRLACLGCWVLGAWGIGRRLGPQDPPVLALIVTASCVILAAGVDVARGDFRPWDAEFRFAGTTHPNNLGTYCALCSLAAFCLLWRARSPRLLLWGLLVAGTAGLLLTKSRSALIAMAVALAVIGALTATRRSLLLPVVLTLWLLSTAAFAAVVLNVDLEQRTLEFARFGRDEDLSTLSDRTPLWDSLRGYIRQRPVLGYGYGGFWTAQRTYDISAQCGWTASGAHSAYLDAWLALGWVGGPLFLAMLFAAIFQGAAQFRARADAGIAFALTALVFSMVVGIAESDFLDPHLVHFLTCCALVPVIKREIEGDHGGGSLEVRPDDWGRQ
jgi:exopolysaccharide production protein ExoQ